jgi:hypothetical protein
MIFFSRMWLVGFKTEEVVATALLEAMEVATFWEAVEGTALSAAAGVAVVGATLVFVLFAPRIADLFAFAEAMRGAPIFVLAGLLAKFSLSESRLTLARFST